MTNLLNLLTSVVGVKDLANLIQEYSVPQTALVDTWIISTVHYPLRIIIAEPDYLDDAQVYIQQEGYLHNFDLKGVEYTKKNIWTHQGYAGFLKYKSYMYICNDEDYNLKRINWLGQCTHKYSAKLDYVDVVDDDDDDNEDGYWFCPADIVMYKDELFVADRRNDIVWVFTTDLTLKRKFEMYKQVWHNSDCHIAVSKDGDLFVCDTHKVHVYDSQTGTPKYTFHVQKESRHSAMVGIAISESNDVFICISQSTNVKVFDIKGKFKYDIQLPDRDEPAVDVAVYGQTVYVLGCNGNVYLFQ
jgi:outer membrane protein assembly factor BamB